MALVNTAEHQLHGKIVYYGPGLAGKTSNLQHIHWQLPGEDRDDLLSIATKTERSLFFRCRVPHFAQLRGYQVFFHLHTIPGCILHASTRYRILTGADGVVFVANSQKAHLANTIERLKELEHIIRNQVPTHTVFPLVLQYNKRDLPNILSVQQLNEHLNQQQWRWFAASAAEGAGVMETFSAICERVFENLQAPAGERAPSLQGTKVDVPSSSAYRAEVRKKSWWK